MKKIIKNYVVISVVAIVLISCATTKKAVPTIPKQHRAVEIGNKYDSLLSNQLDSVWLPIQDLEKQLKGSNDPMTIDKRIDSSVKQLKKNMQTIITSFISDWSDYVADSATVASKSFRPVRITMRAVRNPRVSEILAEAVTVNGVGKDFVSMLRDGIEVGKKSTYFIEGEDSLIFTGVKDVIPYYYTRIKNPSMVTTRNMSIVIRDNIKDNSEVFPSPLAQVKDDHITYQPSTAVKYWSWFVSDAVGNYLAAAMKANVHRRHRLH